LWHHGHGCYARHRLIGNRHFAFPTPELDQTAGGAPPGWSQPHLDPPPMRFLGRLAVSLFASPGSSPPVAGSTPMCERLRPKTARETRFVHFNDPPAPVCRNCAILNRLPLREPVRKGATSRTGKPGKREMASIPNSAAGKGKERKRRDIRSASANCQLNTSGTRHLRHLPLRNPVAPLRHLSGLLQDCASPAQILARWIVPDEPLHAKMSRKEQRQRGARSSPNSTSPVWPTPRTNPQSARNGPVIGA